MHNKAGALGMAYLSIDVGRGVIDDAESVQLSGSVQASRDRLSEGEPGSCRAQLCTRLRIAGTVYAVEHTHPTSVGDACPCLVGAVVARRLLPGEGPVLVGGDGGE